MALIKRDSLRRQQVYRNGVTGKRVHRKNVKVLRLLGKQRKSSIPRSNLDGRLRFAGITENIGRDRFHLRVNFIETKNVTGAAIGSQGPSPQPDDAHTTRPVSTA